MSQGAHFKLPRLYSADRKVSRVKKPTVTKKHLSDLRQNFTGRCIILCNSLQNESFTAPLMLTSYIKLKVSKIQQAANVFLKYHCYSGTNERYILFQEIFM